MPPGHMRRQASDGVASADGDDRSDTHDMPPHYPPPMWGYQQPHPGKYRTKLLTCNARQVEVHNYCNSLIGWEEAMRRGGPSFYGYGPDYARGKDFDR